MTDRARPAAIAFLALAACTAGAPIPSTTTTVPDTTTSTVRLTTTTTLLPRADGNLVVGVMMPGDADSELATAIGVGARLAVEDINAAEANVRIALESTTVSDDVESAFGELMTARADVIVGPPSSALGELLIPLAVSENVVLISPTNSSPSLTAFDDGGLYFRTSASDALQGDALARIVAESGTGGAVAVVFRDDDYGRAIADRFESSWSESGGATPELIPYPSEAGPSRTTAETIASIGPAVVVVAGLEESADVLVELAEAGLTSAGTVFWVSEPAFLELGAQVDDPTVLTGVNGLIHLPFPDLPVDLLDRIQDAPEQPTVLTYVAESYDAVTIAALAAHIAGTDEAEAIAREIPDVARQGEPCSSFSECTALVDAGTDIDYQGLAGPYEFTDDGEPSSVTYEWSRYGDDAELEAPLGTVRVD